MKKFLATIVAAFVMTIGTAMPADAHSISVTTWCDKLAKQPSYSYTYGGARVTVPNGKVLLSELKADGLKGKERQRVCRVLVKEYESHTKKLVQKRLFAQ